MNLVLNIFTPKNHETSNTTHVYPFPHSRLFPRIGDGPEFNGAGGRAVKTAAMRYS